MAEKILRFHKPGSRVRVSYANIKAPSISVCAFWLDKYLTL
jgi:hypothetical protein